jgi:sugar lactone lactonase YvrE
VARFNALSGLCLAASGNLYITDSSSCLVRKITPAGVVSTLAGTGAVGSANGFGQTASFDLPNGISVDSGGNLYVADTRNETIRKIAADGTVTLFAGTVGLSGNTNATGSSARFFRPYSTAVDAAGNVYVADANNQSIRKITSAGVTSTLAGGGGNVGQQDGGASVARFYVPYSLAMDSTGSLYVADSLNSALRKISPAGEVTTIAGSFGQVGSTDGPLDVAEFGVPVGVAVDATGHVFVSDALYNTVRRVADGEVRTHAGVASLTGGAANGAAGVSRFLTPQGMAFDRDGNLYVADTGNHTIRKISPGGTTSTFAGLSGAPGAADGTGTDAQFDNPSGVAVDGAGNVFVADTGNQLIRKISPAGAVVTVAGLAGITGNSDGTGANARFYDPYGVAVDAEGNVFVADTDNSAVRRISPAGVVTTIGGGSYSGLFAEGSGASAHLYSPIGIVVTPTGELFLSDSLSNVIVKAVRESAPVITVQPQALTVTPGTRVNLSVTATGGGIFYQWYFNNSPISGATGSSYVVANAQSAQAGTYSVSVSNSTGALVSSAAPLTVATSSDPGRLINLSILTPLSAGEIMTMGTALGGAGTSGGKALIARAVGPSLGAFGVTGVLPDPQLSMVSLSTGTTIATNDNWAGDAALGVAFSQVGAFPLPADSTDAGVLQSSLSPGNYTVQISDHTGATGTVIAELYDATPSNAFSLTTPRLVNVSVLKKISAGATLTAGFIVGGTTAKTVIVRAVGPTLGFAPFNIPGVMADPKLELFNNATGLKLTENDDWNGDATLVSASAAVGAFSLASGATKDAVLLYTLPPGQYSARVSAADGAGGTMIVEVYEVP